MSQLPAPAAGVRYCGRIFTPAELEEIRAICSSPDFPSRRAIAREVCRRLDWRKPDGGLKDMSCRVALLRMQADGHIALPPACHRAPQPWRLVCTPEADPRPVRSGTRGELGPITLRPVGTARQSALWNELIARYHYIGYTPLPGAQLRYLAYAGSELLAALGFGAAAWRVWDRDAFLGWDDEQRQRHLHLVVNLARFLILPWIRVRYLASSLLAQAARQLPGDWQRRYGYRPVLLETFVECDRFRATCLRAANWTYVGETMGRGKRDRRNNGPTTTFKSVWCYPLDRRFREILTGGRPA